MKKNLCFLSVAVLLMAGCIHEPGGEIPTAEKVFAEIHMTLGSEEDDAGTRSQLSVTGAERFCRAMLFAFDHDSGKILLEDGIPCVKYIESTDFSWMLPLNTPLDILTLVNYGNMDLDRYIRDAGLTRPALAEALVFRCTPSSFLELDDSGYGLPMAGILDGITLFSSSDPVTIKVKKLFARYDFFFDLTGLPDGSQFTCAEIRAVRSNTEVPFFQEGFRQTDLSRLVALDSATPADCFRASAGGATNTVTLYLPENCQGNLSPARSWNEWSLSGASGSDELALCTYVDFDVEMKENQQQASTRSYRLYLGTDIGPSQSNFDVVRNRKQTVGLRLATAQAPVSIALDAGSAVYLPTTGELAIRYGTNGFSSADEVLDYSTGKPTGVSLVAKTLSDDPITIDGVTYARSGTLRFTTNDAPMGSAFILKIGNTDLRATDSRNAVILPGSIAFEGENRVYMPDYDPEGELALISSSAYPLKPEDFSDISLTFSKWGSHYDPQAGLRQYEGSLTFVPCQSGQGLYYLKVSIPYSALEEGLEYDLRGQGRILARARNAQDESVYFTLGEAMVHLDIALCSFLVGSGGFSKTSNVSSRSFPPYSVPLCFLCPGVYCPETAAGHFSFVDYADEDPDDSGRFFLPFRVNMDPNTIHQSGIYYTINERGTSSAVGLHVPAVNDGYKRGTSMSVYVYEMMDPDLLETDWYASDIDDWSPESAWYDGDNEYPEDIFPYKGMWSIYWSGPSLACSYTGSSGTAQDDHFYQDVDVISLGSGSGVSWSYYLRVYDWTEDELDAISGDLTDIYR
ncbi:MAG: DUF4906 domain-containing protein [Bacteroidales bacterium]|nr:DUF4906 domain-containing protein [Bacteroidales bacterium]